MADSSGLAALSEAGVAVWLDDLSRERLNSSNLAGLIAKHHVVGVTTNPTIFATALAHGEAYDEQVRQLAARGASVDAAAREITTTDVRAAADAFLDIHQATDGVDGRVSIEVDPRLAHDTDATVAQALDLWKTVDRPNVFIKIPATVEGLDAITRTLAEGISVNVTLIFSVDRYREVIAAFFAGLEQAEQNGHDLSEIESVASFFVSRVDTEVDGRIDALGTAEATALRGQAAVANARLAYAAFQEELSGERWAALAAAGARPQRPLWASTGVKDPSYADTKYIDELVVSGVVNTMPEKTLYAVEDHANITGDTVTGRADEACRVFEGLSAVGIDVADVYRTLEDQGVEKFDKSWAELLDTITDQLQRSRG
ncbi:MAG: transaldolase [Sciscionella sp.]